MIVIVSYVILKLIEGILKSGLERMTRDIDRKLGISERAKDFEAKVDEYDKENASSH